MAGNFHGVLIFMTTVVMKIFTHALIKLRLCAWILEAIMSQGLGQHIMEAWAGICSLVTQPLNTCEKASK